MSMWNKVRCNRSCFFLAPLLASLTSPQVVLVRTYKTQGLVPVVLFWQTRTQRSRPMTCSTTAIFVSIHGHTLVLFIVSWHTWAQSGARQCRGIPWPLATLAIGQGFSFNPESHASPIDFIPWSQICNAFVTCVRSELLLGLRASWWMRH